MSEEIALAEDKFWYYELKATSFYPCDWKKSSEDIAFLLEEIA